MCVCMFGEGQLVLDVEGVSPPSERARGRQARDGQETYADLWLLESNK